MSNEEIVAAYTSWLNSWSPSQKTVTARRTLAAARMKAWGLDGFTTENIQQFLGTPEWKRWTRATYHAHLKDFCAWLTASGYLDENPMEDVRKPGRPASLPRPLSEREVEMVLAAAGGRVHPRSQEACAVDVPASVDGAGDPERPKEFADADGDRAGGHVRLGLAGEPVALARIALRHLPTAQGAQELVQSGPCASCHFVAWSRFMESTDNLIGTAEAAKMLGRSHRTVHRLVESGELVPAITAPGGFKGAFLFKREDVERVKATREAAA